MVLADVFSVGIVRRLCIIFVECNFTKDIWYLMLKELKLDGVWEGGQFIDCILNWKRLKGER
jgi:hypothetical protein